MSELPMKYGCIAGQFVC